MNKNVLLGLIFTALYSFSTHAMDQEQTYYLITPKEMTISVSTPQVPAHPLSIIYIGDLKALENTTLGDNNRFSFEELTFSRNTPTPFLSNYDGYANFLENSDYRNGQKHTIACIFEASPIALANLTPMGRSNIKKHGSFISYTLYFPNQVDIYNDLVQKTSGGSSFIKALLLPDQMDFWTTLRGVPAKPYQDKDNNNIILSTPKAPSSNPQTQTKLKQEKTVQPSVTPKTQKSISLESIKSLERSIFISQIFSGITLAGSLGLIGFLVTRK